jgi:Xaa-Pro aminopeptidase
MIETNFHEELVRLTSCVGDFRGIPTTDLNHEASVDDFVRFLVGELSAEGWLGSTVGLERWSCVPNPVVAEAIEAALVARRCRVVDATSTLRSVRRLKSPAEIEVIERAQAACDAGLLELQRHVRPGMTELEAWNLFMAGQIAAGGEPAAIHETVAVGPPEPMLHALSGRRRIQIGDYFHADACGAVDRYHARGTRPFFLGEPPTELLRLAQIIGGVFEVLAATARVGMPFRDLHRVLREYYRDAGVSDSDFFAGGYELGISFPPDWVGEFCWSIHDDETDAVIEPGLVTNVESCVFLAMVDTVVFEEPAARMLSKVPRELLVIP